MRVELTILGFDWTSQSDLSVLKSLDHSNLNVESGLGLGRLYQTWLATRSPDAGGDKDPTFQVLIFFLQKIRPFAKLLPLGIETGCGENPMDINPFLGRWKDLVPLTRSGRRKRRKVKKKKTMTESAKKYKRFIWQFTKWKSFPRCRKHGVSPNVYSV